MKRILKWLFAAIFWLTGSLATCVLLLLFLFQVKAFRQMIYPPIIRLVNTLLVARIEVSDVHFTGFSSLEVDGAKLLTEGDTLAQVTRIYADVDILDLLDNRLTIRSVYLQSPRVKLLRNSAGVWNFERIAKPAAPKNPEEPASDFIINAFDVVFDNADIDFVDSVALKTGYDMTGRYVNYSKMQLRDFAVRIAAKEFNVNTLTGKAVIDGMHFREINSGTVVNDLTIKAELEKDKITLEKLKLKMPQTNLDLSASIADFCLMKPIDDTVLRNAGIKLKINKSTVFSDELEKFVSLGLKPGIVFGISSDCDGYLNAININQFVFKSLNSDLKIAGKLSGILDGEIAYKAKINDSKINYRDLKVFLPNDYSAGIPDFGNAYLRLVNASGTDRNASATLDLRSDFGNIAGKANVVFSPGLDYNADVSVTNLNIGRIVDAPSMASRINGHITARGSGTDLSKMNATADVDFRGSRYSDYLVNSFVMKAKMDAGKIILDTCHIEIPSQIGITSLEALVRENMKIDVAGYFNCRNINNPDYDIKALLNDINLSDLLGNANAPDNMSCAVEIAGHGINPDSMMANAKVGIDELVFNNRSQLPFDISVNINTLTDKNKYVKIASDIMNFDLEGDFKVIAASELFANFGTYLAKMINDKIEYVYDPTFKSQPFFADMYASDFVCSAEVNDISIINSFLDGQSVYSRFNFSLAAKSTDQEAEVNLNKFYINEFSYNADSLDIHLRNLNLTSTISITSGINGTAIKQCGINMKATGNSAVGINSTQITSPQLSLSVKEDSIDYSVSAVVNDILDVANSGEVNFGDAAITLLSDSLLMSYADIIHIANTNPVDIVMSGQQIHVRNFSIEEANGIKAILSGSLSLTNFDNMNLDISGINLRKVDTLLQIMQIAELPDIDGNITSVSVNANGLLTAPVYSIGVKTDNIRVNNISAGILDLNLRYKDRNIYGKGGLKNALTDASLFRFDLNSFPIDLALATDSSVRQEVKGVPVDFVASSDSLPLAIISPFISPLSNLNGLAKINLQVGGETIDVLKYKGNIDLPQFDFTLVANNMHYSGKSAIVFDNETIKLKSTKVYNDPSDYKGGNATLQGRIDMKGFAIEKMNFVMNSDGILVLTRNSAKAIPMIYGNLLVSTGDMPVTFNGNLDYMTLNGDINVVKGSLNMPPMNTVASGSIQSNMLYKVEVRDHNGRRYFNVIDNATSDTLYSEVPDVEEQNFKRDSSKTALSSGLTNIKMDLNIRILNPIMLKLDLGTVGQLVAKIGTENSSIPLNFYYDYLHDDIRLNGEISLLDGSQLTYIKQFATKGKISFPSGTVYNPSFDLTATYSGKSTVNDRSREYEVYLYVKGPFSNPKISFGYNMDGNDATGDSTRITQDALFLIVLGRTKTEIESGAVGSSSNTNLGSLGMSSLSAAFSKTMTDLLGGAGSIESAEIDMTDGDSWQDARIKVSGKLFDNIQWKIGGDLNDITNNSEFSLDIPIDLALHPDYLNNIVWHISRSTNIQQTTMNKSQKEWEIMLKFGGSW